MTRWPRRFLPPGPFLSPHLLIHLPCHASENAPQQYQSTPFLPTNSADDPEKMGTGSEPARANPEKLASGEVPVPIFSQVGGTPAPQSSSAARIFCRSSATLPATI